MPFITKTRTTPPDGFVLIDTANDIVKRGLKAAWFPHQGIDVFNAVNGHKAVNEDPDIATNAFDSLGRYKTVNNSTSDSNQYGYDVGDPGYLKIDTELTIVAKIKCRSAPGGASWGRIFSKTNGGTGDNWGVALTTTGLDRRVVFRLNNTSLDYSTPLNAEQIYTLVARYKSGTKEILVDGVVVASSTQTGSITTSGNVKIGNHGSADSRGYRGDIYHLLVFDQFIEDEVLDRIDKNPFQLLAPEKFYFPQEVVAGGFEPAWAKNTNTLIGAF